MKNILYQTAAFLTLFSMASCHGNVDTEGTNPDGGDTSLILTATPEGIVSDGKSETVFTVKLGGMDVTSESVITCTTTDEVIEDSKFSTTKVGTFEFVATHNDLQSNKVNVKAYPEGKGLRLAVDKTEIEADGVDAAKVVIVDENNNVVTDVEENLDYVSLTVVETGQKFLNTNEFTSISNGVFTISAKYENQPCINTVTVRAVNRSKYEKYFHMVPIYDITNIECTFCVDVANGLEQIPSPYKEHGLVMGIHGPYKTSDPWLLSPVANTIQQVFKFGGAYPSVLYNLDTKANATVEEYTGVGIGNRIREQLMDNPSTCGVKLGSKYDEVTGKISLTVSMTSIKAAKYDIGWAILLDNQKVPEHILGSLFDECSDIVVAISGNYVYMSNEAFTSVADTEVSRTFDIELAPSVAVDACGGLKNYRVVGFVLCEDGTKVRMDNAAVCPLGESIDYKLN